MLSREHNLLCTQPLLCKRQSHTYSNLALRAC